ncbi:hypothetical protein FA13DRAFT_1733251 [Coprinellus micaceus]|uniref:Uncharacterized protein n=1 Tax=Coprinellus micaceus TaxID=71717 RepID=A0A4Y7TA75_COPMI|nr:hypothetical protein FA13DRAFT_1733251 [Coprinellus micaceus]
MSSSSQPSPLVLSPSDVLHTRLILTYLGLPTELIDLILDTASYWALITAHRSDEVVVRASDAYVDGHHHIVTSPSEPYADNRYITVAVPAYEGTRVRMVRFRLRSCDQGRSNNAQCRGTYKSTFSWFNVSIEVPSLTPRPSTIFPASRSSPPIPKHKRWFLQNNVHGSRNRRAHEIVWTADMDSGCQGHNTGGYVSTSEGTARKSSSVPSGDPGDELGGRNDEMTGSGTGLGFCQAVVPGSTIAVYACTQFSGWENHVWSAEVEVFCLV